MVNITDAKMDKQYHSNQSATDIMIVSVRRMKIHLYVDNVGILTVNVRLVEYHVTRYKMWKPRSG